MTNGIVAIGGLLALAGIKSRLGSGIRLSPGLYIFNKIPLVHIDYSIEQDSLANEIIQGFLDYFFSHISSEEYEFSGTTVFSENEKMFMIEIDDYYNHHRFKIKSNIDSGELFGSLVVSGGYIDIDLYMYLEDSHPTISANFKLLELFTEYIHQLISDEGLTSSSEVKDYFLSEDLLRNRHWLERYNQNKKDLKSIKNRWGEISQGAYSAHDNEEHLSEREGFTDDTLYSVQYRLFQGGDPYNLFKQPQPIKSRLRKR